MLLNPQNIKNNQLNGQGLGYLKQNWASAYTDSSQAWFPNLLEINIKITNNLVSDLSLFESILSLSFHNEYLDLRTIQETSLLDYLILFTTKPNLNYTTFPQVLFTRLATDWVPQNNLYLYPLCFIYQYQQHNLEDIIPFLAPDLINALSQNLYSFWVSRTLLTYGIASFDTLIAHIDAHYLASPGFIFFLTILPNLLIFTAIFFSLVLTSLNRLLPFAVIRAYKQLYKTSVNMSSNFEFIFFIISSLLLYILMLLLVSDDTSEQVYELVSSYYLIIFTYLILALVLSYSLHIFAFLSLATYSKRSLLLVFRQFKNDIMDLLSLVMRFYVLLFRLNVYDLLEDLFDGYYIFLGDFGDEYLLDSSLVLINSFDGFTQNNIEDNFDFEDTNSSIGLDLFRLYYFFWGEFAFFYVFCLEEGARLLLATYIVFLIFFEIHATNMRFLERYSSLRTGI